MAQSPCHKFDLEMNFFDAGSLIISRSSSSGQERGSLS